MRYEVFASGPGENEWAWLDFNFILPQFKYEVFIGTPWILKWRKWKIHNLAEQLAACVRKHGNYADPFIISGHRAEGVRQDPSQRQAGFTIILGGFRCWEITWNRSSAGEQGEHKLLKVQSQGSICTLFATEYMQDEILMGLHASLFGLLYTEQIRGVLILFKEQRKDCTSTLGVNIAFLGGQVPSGNIRWFQSSCFGAEASWRNYVSLPDVWLA